MPASLPPMSEVAWLFLKLGTIAFGGPAAHIAMMRDEVVRRRRWLSDEQFVDLLGATNLIPGPNSTEMAIHLGYLRAGWPGLVVAGCCFIVPAMFIVFACAWLYVRYGARPEAGWLLYGVKPVIIAIVVQAIWGLLRSAEGLPPGRDRRRHAHALTPGSQRDRAAAGRRRRRGAADDGGQPWRGGTSRTRRRRGPHDTVSRIPEDRFGALRKRLRAPGLPSPRFRRSSRLADRP